MDVKELIKLDSHKVRGNSSLMAIYIQAYEQQFGRKPNCAGCTFANDWARFVLAVKGGENKSLTTKSLTMENTYKLKKVQGKILAYKAGGKTYRLYDNNLNESFVLGFLTNGTEEQIKERKALFAVLPEQLRKEPKTSEKKDDKPEPVAEEVNVIEVKEETTIEPEKPKEKKTRAKRGSKKQ